MKKVLALVLAVIMVCTMAMAVTIDFGGDTAVPGAGATKYPIAVPGSTLYFELADLLDDAYGAYYNADNEFVPANNKVTVTYGKGAELVKSAGWVQVGEDKTEDDSWEYQIVLKDNDAATADGKALDFSITKLTYKATGFKVVEIKFDDADKTANTEDDKLEFDYGWPVDTLPLFDEKETNITYMGDGFSNFVPLNKIVTLEAVEGLDEKGEACVYKANSWFMGIDDVFEVRFDVKAGQKILRKNYDSAAFDNAEWRTKYGIGANADIEDMVVVVNDTNLVGAGTLSLYVNNNYQGINFYAVAIDGTITKVAMVVDDGVATFKLPAYSALVAVDGTLKNVAAPAADTTETGTTTNPGTGANDVVGVAAALAVVALVSGAAISLKK